MRITFSKADRQLVAKRLKQSDLIVTEIRIDRVLNGIHSANMQQFDEDIDIMVGWVETETS